MFTFCEVWRFVALGALILTGCQSSSPTSVSQSNPPQLVGAAQDTSDNILIRVDRVQIHDDVGDSDGTGEFHFDMLVTRQRGTSTRLQYPGDGTYQIQIGDQVQLDDFSLRINQVHSNEKIMIAFLGFDEDDQGIVAEELTDTALDAAMIILEEGLKATATELLSKIPGSGFAFYFMSRLSGEALDWWRKADLIGAYAIILEPSNHWMLGESYQVKSNDGNMSVHFSVIDSDNPIVVSSSGSASGSTSTPVVASSSGSTPKSTATPKAGDAVVQPTSTPHTCSISVASAFRSVWQRGGGIETACPTGSVFTRDGAYERFQNGLMIWVAGPNSDAGGTIYVIHDSGNWQDYADTWVEGQMDRADYQPPAGLLEPQRGFGKVWREQLDGPSAAIGWAEHIEQATQVTIQPFDNTGVIISFGDHVYFLPHDQRWNQ